MIAKDIADNIIQPVRLSDNCLQVMGWMEEYKVMQLPVVDNGQYYGMLSEAQIYGLDDPDVDVARLKDELDQDTLDEADYITDVLAQFVNKKATLVPVLNQRKEYVGCISQHALLQAVGELEDIGMPGAVIVLELNLADYVLSEIAQIAEASDIRLLSLHTYQHPDSMQLDVILKTNSDEIDSFLRTLERYDYHVKMTMSEKDMEQEKLSENYEYIMTYLGI